MNTPPFLMASSPLSAGRPVTEKLPFSVSSAIFSPLLTFTSQLTHLVSNAYVKSHTAGQLKGFTGGSYRDMTRVAWLNPEMWAELFLENADNLSAELSGLIAELEKYRAAIDSGDRETLTALLAEGRRIKGEAENK